MKKIMFVFLAAAAITYCMDKGYKPAWERAAVPRMYPLHWAIARNDMDLLKYQAKSEDVNQFNPLGKTPLMTAIDNGNMEAVEILIENGADPELRSSTTNQSAKDIARRLKNKKILKALSK